MTKRSSLTKRRGCVTQIASGFQTLFHATSLKLGLGFAVLWILVFSIFWRYPDFECSAFTILLYLPGTGSESSWPDPTWSTSTIPRWESMYSQTTPRRTAGQNQKSNTVTQIKTIDTNKKQNYTIKTEIGWTRPCSKGILCTVHI